MKTEFVLTLFRSLEQNQNEENEEHMVLGKILEKNCKVLTYEFALILNMAPTAFHNILVKYLTICKSLIECEWKSDMVVKCNLMMLYYTLKQFVYYSSPSSLQSTGMLERMKINNQLQNECHQNFTGFFTQEVIGGLLNHMLTCTMLREKSDDFTNIQLLIEENETTSIDEVICELDCTIKKLCIALVEQLMLRFTDISLQLIYSLVEQLVSGNLNSMSFSIQENIITALSILPNLYKNTRINIPEQQWLNIGPVLDWLSEKSSSYKFFSRRYPHLLKFWVDCMNSDQKEKQIPKLIECLSSEDVPTRFGAIMSLRLIVTHDSEWEIDMAKLIELTFPVVIQMMGALTNPHLIWPISSFMTKLIMKSHYNMTPNTITVLQSLNLDHLLQNNDIVIRSCFVDMFKAIITTHQFGEPLVHIYDLCLKYLSLSFPKMEKEETME